MPEEALPDGLAYAYLERLGVDAMRGEIDAATLAAILRAQTTRVPYENLDIYRGSPPGIEPVSCVERVVAGRGGYCYHQNGALFLLLRWLEVDATRHISGVEMRSSTAPHLNANHMGITVRTPDEQSGSSMPGSAMDRRRPCRSRGASTNRTASPIASGRRRSTRKDGASSTTRVSLFIGRTSRAPSRRRRTHSARRTPSSRPTPPHRSYVR